MTHALQKTGIEPFGIVGEQADSRDHSGITQHCESAARHQGVGIRHRRHHAAHTRFDQALRARRCTAMMGTGFQGDIGRSPARSLTRRRQRDALGMQLAGPAMPALADHLSIAHQHTADTWVGIGRVQPSFGQTQGPRHEAVVIGAVRAVHCSSSRKSSCCRRASGVSCFSSRSISSRNAFTSWNWR